MSRYDNWLQHNPADDIEACPNCNRDENDTGDNPDCDWCNGTGWGHYRQFNRVAKEEQRVARYEMRKELELD